MFFQQSGWLCVRTKTKNCSTNLRCLSRTYLVCTKAHYTRLHRSTTLCVFTKRSIVYKEALHTKLRVLLWLWVIFRSVRLMSIHQSPAGSVSSDIFSSVNKKNCASSYISPYWRTGLTRCGYHQTPYTRGFIAMAAPDRHTHSSPPNHISHSHQTSCFWVSSNSTILGTPPISLSHTFLGSRILLPSILDQRYYRSAKIFTPFHICVFAQLHFCMIGGEVKLWWTLGEQIYSEQLARNMKARLELMYHRQNLVIALLPLQVQDTSFLSTKPL